VGRGLVRLDEHVDRYVPWFKSRRGSSLAPITVRQLLSHTAGVERDGADHWQNDRFPTLRQIKSRVRDGIAIFAPLERWKYSNLLTNAIDGPAEPLMIGVFQTINDCLKPPARSIATRASLRKYEGRYVGRWWDLEIIAMGDRPLREASVLERRSRERFQIIAGPGGGHVGEAVTFRWRTGRGPVGLWWGPHPMRRERRRAPS
jgi:beta-lactamase family protein